MVCDLCDRLFEDGGSLSDRQGCVQIRLAFGLVGTVIAHPLPVLVHFIHQHFSCAEIKGAQVHGAAQVTCQLWLAPELLTTWAEVTQSPVSSWGSLAQRKSTEMFRRKTFILIMS